MTATLTAALLGATVSSATQSFAPVADSYVHRNNRNKNFGTATTLRVDNSPILRTYLRFDVRNVSGTITQATLRLYSRSSSSVGYSVRSVANNTWGEKTITYQNAPTFSATITGSSGPFASGAWVPVDITPLVRGNGLVSFALTTTTATEMTLASREYGGSFAPRLVVESTTAPVNSSAPTVSGTPEDGQTLTADRGTWTGTEPISYGYQWRRCDAAGANCTDIPGATDATYTLTAADVGKTIRVAVTASNSAGSGTSTSANTDVVRPTPPANSLPPTVSGIPEDGRTLTADRGTWTGTEPISYGYQWRRCDAAGANCADIPGGTQASFTLTAGEVGNTIRVAVTASNRAGSVTATSANTDVVRPVPPGNSSPPTISGTPEDGQTLTAHRGTWTGTDPISYAYRWRACEAAGANCTDIPDATDANYTLTAADVGKTIRVAVTGSNSVGSDTAVSAASEAVGATASTFGVAYWPAGRNSSNTLTSDYWASLRPTVERDLDQIVSMGGGVVRMLLWSSSEPRAWRLRNEAGVPEVDESLLQDQATNLVDLLGLCHARGLKVILGMANPYLHRKDSEQYWWEWGYGPYTEDPSDTDGWDLFLADSLKWVNGFVTKIEASPSASAAVIMYSLNQPVGVNPWSNPYLRHHYDYSAVPAGKRAASLGPLDRDLPPLVSGLEGRHLDYVSFHSYPIGANPINPDVSSAYDQMTTTFPDSTILLGEFGRVTPLNSDGTVNDAAEDGQEQTVSEIIGEAKENRIPYYLNWMLWDDSPPTSEPTALGYEPHKPKDAFGRVLGLTTLLRNPDMEAGTGTLPGWAAGGTSTVPGADLTVTLNQRGSAADPGATNTRYARLSVENPPGHAWLRSSPVSVTPSGLLSVNAYVRSNMRDVGLKVTQTLTNGDRIETSGPTFTPAQPSWRNWLHSAGDWRLCLDSEASKIEVAVRGYADTPSPSEPYYLDVDAVSAATRPRPPSCP